jgi:NAD dependent epimerase/dehydratase
MKKLLITGACGFIGSHLTEMCVEQGYSVTAFDRYNSENHWGWLENSKYKSEIQVILGDIRDYDSVLKASKNIDAVMHLAALIGIPYSYDSPLAYIRTNIEGTYNILQASREREIDNILITSTSETYGSAQTKAIDENHPKVGQSPYSATKIAADQLAISFHRSFNMPIKIVRPFNTYGPRQSSRAIIPNITSQLLHSNKLKLGNLEPTRDFTYVTDTCSAFLEILDCPKLIGQEVNIGMNEEISIEQLAYKIARILGKEFEIEGQELRKRPSSSEVERLNCDNKKILELTNWNPKYNLDSGLSETIEWLKDYSSTKMGEYNV